MPRKEPFHRRRRDRLLHGALGFVTALLRPLAGKPLPCIIRLLKLVLPEEHFLGLTLLLCQCRVQLTGHALVLLLHPAVFRRKRGFLCRDRIAQQLLIAPLELLFPRCDALFRFLLQTFECRTVLLCKLPPALQQRILRAGKALGECLLLLPQGVDLLTGHCHGRLLSGILQRCLILPELRLCTVDELCKAALLLCKRLRCCRRVESGQACEQIFQRGRKPCRPAAAVIPQYPQIGTDILRDGGGLRCIVHPAGRLCRILRIRSNELLSLPCKHELRLCERDALPRDAAVMVSGQRIRGGVFQMQRRDRSAGSLQMQPEARDCRLLPCRIQRETEQSGTLCLRLEQHQDAVGGGCAAAQLQCLVCVRGSPRIGDLHLDMQVTVQRPVAQAEKVFFWDDKSHLFHRSIYGVQSEGFCDLTVA